VRRLAWLPALALLLIAAPAADAAHRSVRASGVIHVLHADPADPAMLGHYEFALGTVHGLVALRPRPGVTLLPGMFMTLRGRLHHHRLTVLGAVRSVPRTHAERRLSAREHISGPTPKVAAILINFASDTSTPFTPNDVSQLLFGSGASVTNYYLEQSFGKTQLSGTVLGWYTISASTSTCDYATWASQAQAAAGSAITGYDHVMYLFPTEVSCNWAGLGDLTGPETWINGYLELRVLAHELGHNFGVHHANSLSCTSGGVRTALAGTCTSVEYGDPFSVMGSGDTEQFPAFHKGELGWLAPTSTYTVTATTTVTVAPSEVTTAAPQLIRIPRTSDALYVDFRQPFGSYFDTFTPGSPPAMGVMIRRGPLAYNETQPALIDTTPQTPTYYDAALTVGSSLTDPVTGIVIETDSIGPDGATVTITKPGGAQAPTAPGNVAAVENAGGIDVSWDASTDDGNIDHYRIFRNGALLGTVAGDTLTDHDAPPNGVALVYAVTAVDNSGIEGPAGASAPVSIGDATVPSTPVGLQAIGSSSGIALSWQASVDDVGVDHYLVYRDAQLIASPTGTTYDDTSAEVGVLHGYTVRAVDGSGNMSPESAQVTATVPDTTPPTPPSGLQVVTKYSPMGATLNWQAASDNVGVIGYRVWRDGLLVGTAFSTTYTDPWDELFPSVTYSVAALDGAGHESTHITAIAYAPLPPPPPDRTAPGPPLPVHALKAKKGKVILDWGPGSDNRGVVRYEVIYRGAVILRTTHRSATVRIAVKKGRKFSISVRCDDAAGNHSALATTRIRMK
jgi:fibronectin type 3 domain-containing protein